MEIGRATLKQRLVLICLSSHFLSMLMEFNPFIFWWGKSERIKGQRENGKIFAEICFYFNSFPFKKVQLPPGNVDSCFRIPLWVFICNLFFFSYRIQFFISKRELFLSFFQSAPECFNLYRGRFIFIIQPRCRN